MADPLIIPQNQISALWKILLATADTPTPDTAFDAVLGIHEAAADYWAHVQANLQFAMDQGDNKYRRMVRDGAVQIAARCLLLIIHMTETPPPPPPEVPPPYPGIA